MRSLNDTIDGQRKLSEFVNREVYYCVSSLIYELAQNEKYMDELMGVCSRPTWTHEFDYECGCGHSWSVEDGDPVPVQMDSYKDIDEPQDHLANCPECHEPNEPTDVRSFESDYEEAYEHWVVSDWLAGKLEAKGEMVLRDFLGLTIWGRTCTGQAISLDYVIEQIYLEGPGQYDKEVA